MSKRQSNFPNQSSAKARRIPMPEGTPAPIPARPRSKKGPYCKVCDRTWTKRNRRMHESVREVLEAHGVIFFNTSFHTALCERCFKILLAILFYIKHNKTENVMLYRGNSRGRWRQKTVWLSHGDIRHRVPRFIWEEAFKMSISKPFPSSKPKRPISFYEEDELLEWADCDTTSDNQIGAFLEPRIPNVPHRLLLSSIHGWGFFVSVDVRKGQYIAEYNGYLVSKKDSDELEANYQTLNMKRTYMIALNDTVIDATRTHTPARFINHSCNANAEYVVVTENGEDRVYVEAMRNITKGEEVTCNYSLTGDTIEGEPCRCGAKSCKKMFF